MKSESDASAVVDHDNLLDFAELILRESGLDSDHATIVADSLVDANLRGIDTHGVVRLEAYVDRIESGGLNASADMSVTKAGAAASIVDAKNAPGQVAAVRAIEEGMSLANSAGGAFVGVKNSNHFGTASYFTNKAANEGYIGISMTHAGPNVVPFGGADPYFGTNPISIALPNGGKFPITLDMATSVTAKGNVILAEEEDNKIPPEWAVDETGQPITDPHNFHALRPMGGPKGYGLAFMIDALSGLLMDTVFGKNVPTMYDDVESPQSLGHFIAVIDVGAFVSVNKFVARLRQMREDIKSSRTASDFDEILVPGEPEKSTYNTRVKSGIPLGHGVWDTIQSLSDQYGVHIDTD